MVLEVAFDEFVLAFAAAHVKEKVRPVKAAHVDGGAAEAQEMDDVIAHGRGGGGLPGGCRTDVNHLLRVVNSDLIGGHAIEQRLGNLQRLAALAVISQRQAIVVVIFGHAAVIQRQAGHLGAIFGSAAAHRQPQ